MKLSEMKRLLAEHHIRLTKSLGQNFLHDGNQLRKIAAAAELERSDKVLEIGPGLGPLTEVLLSQAEEVLAIEKDTRLVEVLRARFGSVTGARLQLLDDDALDFLQREPRDWRNWKMVSNLPYSVASPILVELAQAPTPPKRIVATLQLEVVKRLVASSGEDDYGLLTLLMQVEYAPGPWFRVPASCFFPEPEVASGCITLLRREHPLLSPGQRPTFTKIVKRAFSQRRKMMLKLLKEDWPTDALESAFPQAGIPPNARAEMLTVEQFAHLTRTLYERTNEQS